MQQKSRPSTSDRLQKVYRLLAELETPEEVAAFLEDVCTFRELEQMATRTECAEYLLRGDTYQEIISRTEISSTTLSRISRCIQRGSGGYATLLRNFIKQEQPSGKDPEHEA